MKQHERRVSTEIQRGIGKFLDSLRGERNASAHTLRAYSNELGRFAEYLGAWMASRDEYAIRQCGALVQTA